MPPIRAWRKRRQIENVLGPLAELTGLLERPAHIVDFCASSGHVALPAAAVPHLVRLTATSAAVAGGLLASL